MTTIDDYELTTIRIVVGFLTLFAALSLSDALRDMFESSVTLEKVGPWMTALTAFALMILGSLLLSSRAQYIRKKSGGKAHALVF